MFNRKLLGTILFIPTICCAVEFNISVLDAVDRENIDLSVFSKVGYVLPGRYILGIKSNNHLIPELPVMFHARGLPEESAEACITSDVLAKLGLKDESIKLISYWHNGECADFSELKGISIRNAINEGYIAIGIPLAYMEYSDADWVPPAFWDNGLPSLMLDYSATAYESRFKNKPSERKLSVYGTLGANLGAWRFRGDFQGGNQGTGDAEERFNWSRIYAYRALPSINSTLVIGDNYLGSDLFDSFRYTGIALSSDDRMLPPALQGYAPEIRGIAKTNAKVTISQNANILYETIVPAGPFNIQELGRGVRGQLQVKVLEQDGSIQTFSVDTATIPYLTRPGSVRYKAALGKSSASGYKSGNSGDILFGSSEFSWGVSNSWSLFGGSIFSEKYNAVALGLGRDLYQLGALSLDITRSAANLANENDRQGFSYRLNYSKRFDEIDGDIAFAGYRFSQREFMSMNEFLEANKALVNIGNSKSMYTVTGSKSFSNFKTSVYASYTHQDYWNIVPEERIQLSVSKMFDSGFIKGMSANLSFSKNVNQNSSGNMLSMNLSIPMGQGASAHYAASRNNDVNSHDVTYSNYQNDGNHWQISAGVRNKEGGSAESVRGYYAHEGAMASTTLSVGHESGEYWSAAATVRSAITITAEGAALHQQSVNGGTRLMLDTAGVGGVAINGGRTQSNYWGKAVVGDVNSYARTSAAVDVNQLADDVEVSSPVVDATLTEGAVGYRKLSVQQGMKLMTTLTLPDGRYLPFGVQIVDVKGRVAGLVSDAGMAYLSGINSDSEFTATWSDSKCRVYIAEKYTPQSLAALTCVPY
ncbi:MAG: fimbria/pilus outer membrane usher protein [Proteobacteria bacterium]|nr:fimbria/pilus outer membrane usher protein [Pseudomonadota bacterium]